MDDVSAPSPTNSTRRWPTCWARLIVVMLVISGLVGLWIELAGSPSQTNVLLVFSVRHFVLLGMATYVAFWVIYFTISQDSARSKFARCVLATLAFLTTVGILECLALANIVDCPRVMGTLSGFKTCQDSRWWRYDSELLYMRRPNQSIKGKTKGDACYRLGAPPDRYYQMDVKYDSNGFRNAREYESVDAVVIGDSFVEAGLIPLENTMAQRLANKLGMEVANLGISSYGPKQESIVLRRYGMPLQPKTIVWVFFEGNDLRDDLSYARHKRNNRPGFTRQRFIDRSFTLNALSALSRLTSRWVETGRRRRGTFTTSDGSRQPMYFVYDQRPLTDEDEKCFEAAFQSIQESHRVAQEAGADFLFVFAPTKFRVYGSLCEFADESPCKDWQLTDLPKRIRNECQALGIEFLDLTPRLKNAADTGEIAYFVDDSHWNELGNAVAAAAIGEWVGSRRRTRVTESASTF